MNVENLIPNVSVLKQVTPNKNKRIFEGEYLYLGPIEVIINGDFKNSDKSIIHSMQKYDKDSESKLVGPIIPITKGELESLYNEIYRVDIN